MNTHILISHIKPPNTSHLSKLFVDARQSKNKWNELKRLFYRNLYNGISNSANKGVVTEDKVIFYKDDSPINGGDFSLLQARMVMNTTILTEFKDILKVDKIIAKHIVIVRENLQEIVFMIKK